MTDPRNHYHRIDVPYPEFETPRRTSVKEENLYLLARIEGQIIRLETQYKRQLESLKTLSGFLNELRKNVT